MNTPEMESDVRQRGLLREAAQWHLTGLLFECPTGGWHEHVAALEAEVADADLKAAAEAAQEEATEGLYHSTFGPGGPASPREVSYRDLVQPGYLMAELSSYYEAFSYRAATQEAPDHVSVEAGFVGYLRLKQAYALACSDTEHAAITAESAERFLAEHLSHLAEPLAQALADSGVRYLALAGAALRRRVGPRQNQAAGPGLPILSDGEESVFECGGGVPLTPLA
jgi:nitrate reductase assembly molybdenum cofactor insertion protein NarJ